MRNSEQDIDKLFDESTPLLRFLPESIESLPDYGSIIYAVFLDKTEFIYVGIGGLSGVDAKTRDPRSRIRQHIQGRRSGDQFCIYIQDFYVIPNLIRGDYVPVKGKIDAMVREFIQSRLYFRFVVFQSDDCDKIVRRLEREVQMGNVCGQFPKINRLNIA